VVNHISLARAHPRRGRRPGRAGRLLDGQPKIDAGTAERLGLGEGGAPTGLAAAGSRARAFAALSKPAMRGYVELARAPLRARLDEHLARAAQIQLSLFAEGRYRDALAAAIAPPAFRRPSK
jgi:hypothetical protein